MADTQQAQSISANESLNLLAQEWMFIAKSVEWNINIYDRYRAALFALASASAGVQFLQLDTSLAAGGLPLGVWIVLPLVTIAILYRMLSQFHLVNVKNARLSRIEKIIEERSMSRDYFRLNSIIKLDNRRILTNPYTVTQLSIYLLAVAGILYAENQGFTGLSQLGMDLFGVSVALVFRGVVWAYLALLVAQSLLVWGETGKAAIEEKLHG